MIDAIAGLVAAIWIAAVAAKITDARGFGDALEALIGRPVARLLAPTVLGVEGCLAIGLLAGSTDLARAVMVASSAALSLFAVVVAIQRSRDPGGACACFGPLSTTSSSRHMVLNAVAATLILAAALLPLNVVPDPWNRFAGLLAGLTFALGAFVVWPWFESLRGSAA